MCEEVVFSSLIPEAQNDVAKEHFTFVDDGTSAISADSSTPQRTKPNSQTAKATRAAAPPSPNKLQAMPAGPSNQTADAKAAGKAATVASRELKAVVGAEGSNASKDASSKDAPEEKPRKKSVELAELEAKIANCPWTWKWAKALLKPCPPEKSEKIRRGCILLRDAYDGRASHGLFSLQDGPAYKRVLFQIQTAQWWQNVLIWANLIHAGLIAFEAQNWTVSWVNPDLDPIWVKVTEVICIILYSTDALMKMNYFGGWSDYVSKEWQRNYLTLIFLFAADLGLYTFHMCPLRFTRPFRLFILTARHRDVRRLASFIPRMATKLFDSFALPLFMALSFFSILCTRLYGWMPNEGDYGNEHFGTLARAFQSLFFLSTLDNYDPIVVDAFHLSGFTFFLFLFFIVSTSFFLMSMALGEVFDMYVEDNIATVTKEAKKESKSLDKAFKKLDVDGTGGISWENFREMLRYMRPNDEDRRAWQIFKAITQESGIPLIDRERFMQIGEVLHVSFVPLSQKYTGSAVGGHQYWAIFQRYVIMGDCFTMVLGIDSWLIANVDISWLIPELPALYFRVSTLLVWTSLSQILYIGLRDYNFFMRMSQHSWRQADLCILLVSFACCCLLLPCPVHWQPSSHAAPCFSCAVPWRQLLMAIDAMRVTRIILHTAEARLKFISVLHVLPVMMHLGGLMLTLIYFFGISTMEMLSGAVCDSTRCSRRLPNFDCASNSLLSMFQLSVGSDWADVVEQVEKGPNAAEFSYVWKCLVNVWMMIAYVILGIGVTNLLTALMFEFHKMLREEEEEHIRVIKASAAKRKAVFRRLLAAMRMRRGFNLDILQSEEVETEVMIGRVYGNWRRKLHSNTQK